MLEHQITHVVVARFLGGDASYPLDPTLDLLQAGICDSLGLMELATDLESQFSGIHIDDQEITTDNLGSVQRIAAFLQSKGVA